MHTMLKQISCPARLLRRFRALENAHFNVRDIHVTIQKACPPETLQRLPHCALRGPSPNRLHTTDTTHQYADFFRYTSGRWLWDEEQQLLDRYKAFNVPELQRIATTCVGASTCIGMTKLGEGGYNKVFRLIMDNGSTVIVRIPNPNAGPAGYTTASEVATMDFARTILQIPVPNVFAWNCRPNNAVGSEYIIMKEAEGMNLDASWNEMDLEEKSGIVDGVISIEKTLSSLSFTRYGSIYYAGDCIEGCTKAEVVGDISEALRKDVESRFVIGPIVERQFWSNERSEIDIDRGPWETPQGYMNAIARREIAWISRYAVPKSPVDPLQRSMAQNSPEAHISLLRRFLAVTPYLLPRDASLVASSLWHRDIHGGNIFVKDGRITSLIDWQATWAGPLCIQVRQPRLLDHKGEVLLRLPENFKKLDLDEQDRLNKQVSASILLHVYETRTAQRNPLLSSLYRLRHGQTRIQPILFAGDTWIDDILPFRESLIRVERYWDQLDVNVPCPLHFTSEELQSHAKDGEGWNEAQDFWDSVAGLVTPEGWTSNDMYAEASGLFSELRQNALKNMTGRQKESFEAQTRWAETK